jgi:hypothetical protein
MSDALLSAKGLSSAGDSIEVFPDHVVVKGLLRNVSIPLADITEIRQTKASALMAGKLEFYVKGSYQIKNTLYFWPGKESQIEEARKMIDQQQTRLRGGAVKVPVPAPSPAAAATVAPQNAGGNGNGEHSEAAELEKWAELKTKGLITEEEFQQMKKQILSGQNQVIHEKETIKEIVKMPCRYCGTLVEITATRCPNCAAPLK